MDVVHEDDGAGLGLPQRPLRDVGRVAVLPVQSVGVPKHGGQTGPLNRQVDGGVAGPVRRAHQRDRPSGRSADGLRRTRELAFRVGRRHARQVGVGVAVVSDLEAALGHLPGQPREGVDVLPHHEEGGRRPGPPELGHEIGGVRAGPVVEGQRHAAVAPAVGPTGGQNRCGVLRLGFLRLGFLRLGLLRLGLSGHRLPGRWLLHGRLLHRLASLRPASAPSAWAEVAVVPQSVRVGGRSARGRSPIAAPIGRRARARWRPPLPPAPGRTPQPPG